MLNGKIIVKQKINAHTLYPRVEEAIAAGSGPVLTISNDNGTIVLTSSTLVIAKPICVTITSTDVSLEN
jgi:hypothetical protein